MNTKGQQSILVLVKDIPVLLMDTSTQKTPIVVDGTTSALEQRMQYDARSPYWDEDE